MLKVQKNKLHATISREFFGYRKAEYLVVYIIDESDLCWENMNSKKEEIYSTLIKTTYGYNTTKSQTGECWQIVKLMLRVFLRELKK